MPQIVISGIGVVSPHGTDAQAMFEALMRGESAVQPVFAETNKPAAAVAATIAAFDVSRWFTKLQLAGVDRVSQFAVAAADLALCDAKAQGQVDGLRVGVYVGCGMGGATALEAAYRAGLQGARVPPLTIPAFMPNASAAHVAMRQGVLGPVMTYSMACASSSVAIAEAAKALRHGEIDLAIAGGSEAVVVPGVVAAWQAMQTLATITSEGAARSCRPFATDRSGFALGEGAAFVVMEDENKARQRGAKAYAALAGAGLSCDASHLTKPNVAGQKRALLAALHQAGLTPGEVGYCNAHGTATRVGDVVESQALIEVWHDAMGGLQVSSTKALHGHLLGGAGALEAVITVLALQQQRLPPNAHCDTQDSDCGIPLVLNTQQSAPHLKAAISNSFAFGGTNSVLAFRRL